MHVQGVGFHFASKHLVCDIGKALFVPFVGEKKEYHAGEHDQEKDAEEQLPEGNRGMFFQRIT